MKKKDKQKKFTLKEFSKAWKKLYGESLREEYSGVYRYLKNK